MKESYLPIFGNTCGKLYEDYILLASENSERTLPLTSVKKLSFKKRVTLGSLMFILLPAAFFVLPRFMGNEDYFIKILMYAIGTLFFAISIQKAEKKNTVKIFTKNGAVLKIRVIEENTKDAKKFVSEATKLLVKHKAAAKAELIEQRTAQNIFTTVSAMAGSR